METCKEMDCFSAKADYGAKQFFLAADVYQ